MFLKPLGPIPRSSVRWSPLILPAPARDGSLGMGGIGTGSYGWSVKVRNGRATSPWRARIACDDWTPTFTRI